MRSSKTFSVLTVSMREGWLGIGHRSMERQGMRVEKWVVVSPEPIYKLMDYRFEKVDEIVLVKEPEKTRKSNLNAALNAGLKLITSDYVIFYQDYIDLQGDCFKRLLALAGSRTFVTTCSKNPAGKPEDPRYLGVDCPRPCRPDEWEANIAIAPMKVIRKLGGFDEEYDDGWSWDNVNLAERAEMLGCKFVLDEGNRPQLHRHGPPHDGSVEANGERHARIMKEIRDGTRPIRCNYLK